MRLCLTCGFIILFAASTDLPVRAQILLDGEVRDSLSGAPLAGAHIRVTGADIGSVAGTGGRFRLRVSGLPVTLDVSHVGYKTEQVTVTNDTPPFLVIRLEPATVMLGDVTVLGEDFAADLMSRVIARKQLQRLHLKTYTVRGYSKVILEKAGEITFLSEAIFDIFWDRSRGPREVVRTFYRTSDLVTSLPVPVAGYIPDLYADTVSIQGIDFIGPTHPDAHTYYHFSASRRAVGDSVLYDVFVSPRDALHATLIGMLTIVEGDYVMVRADLRPSPHTVFPDPLESWQVVYVQDFEPYADSLWMPVNLDMEGTFTISDDGLYRRTIPIRQTSRISGYRVNVTLPDAPYETPDRLTVDSSSMRFDFIVLRDSSISPLTPHEFSAVERLRRQTLTLEEAYPAQKRPGLIAMFLRENPEGGKPRLSWPMIMGYQIRFRYNRVDGLYSSVGQSLPFSRRFGIDWRLAQASGLSRVRGSVYAWHRLGEKGFVSAEYGRDVEARRAGSLYPVALVSLPVLLGGEDYFDYYWNERVSMTVGRDLSGVRVSAGMSQERHESLERQITRALPFRQKMRTNPNIEPGRIRTLKASVATGGLGGDMSPSGHFGARLGVEHSSEWYGSDFDYAASDLLIEFRLPTFFRNRPRPNTLDVILLGRVTTGSLPVQRFGLLDAGLGPFHTPGTFRSLRDRSYEGEQILGVFWEHDFKTTWFEALRWWPLVRTGTGFTVFGAFGRTWIGRERRAALPFSPRYHDSFQHEIGVSLTRVLGSPLRLDMTYRLDEPGFHIGFGFSSRIFRPGNFR